MWVSRWLNSVASTSHHVRISQKLDNPPMCSGFWCDTLLLQACVKRLPGATGDCEVFMVDVKRILTEGRFHGATHFYNAGDLNVQMGFDDVTEQGASLYETHVWTGVCKKLHPCHWKTLRMDGQCRLLCWGRLG